MIKVENKRELAGAVTMIAGFILMFLPLMVLPDSYIYKYKGELSDNVKFTHFANSWFYVMSCIFLGCMVWAFYEIGLKLYDKFSWWKPKNPLPGMNLKYEYDVAQTQRTLDDMAALQTDGVSMYMMERVMHPIIGFNQALNGHPETMSILHINGIDSFKTHLKEFQVRHVIIIPTLMYTRIDMEDLEPVLIDRRNGLETIKFIAFYPGK